MFISFFIFIIFLFSLYSINILFTIYSIYILFLFCLFHFIVLYSVDYSLGHIGLPTTEACLSSCDFISTALI